MTFKLNLLGVRANRGYCWIWCSKPNVRGYFFWPTRKLKVCVDCHFYNFGSSTIQVFQNCRKYIQIISGNARSTCAQKVWSRIWQWCYFQECKTGANSKFEVWNCCFLIFRLLRWLGKHFSKDLVGFLQTWRKKQKNLKIWYSHQWIIMSYFKFLEKTSTNIIGPFWGWWCPICSGPTKSTCLWNWKYHRNGPSWNRNVRARWCIKGAKPSWRIAPSTTSSGRAARGWALYTWNWANCLPKA